MLTPDSSINEFAIRLLEVLNESGIPADPPTFTGMRLGYNMPMMGPWRKERGLFEDASSGLRADYLADIEPFEIIRYMVAQRTNGSTTTDIASEDIPFSEPVPMSSRYIAAHAQAAGKRPWVSIPHQADDDLIRHMATMLHGQQPIVEYSNEPFTTHNGSSLWMANQIDPDHSGADRRRLAYQYVASRLPGIKAIWKEIDPDAVFVYSVGMFLPPPLGLVGDSDCDWVATAAYVGIESTWQKHVAMRTAPVTDLMTWLQEDSLPRVLGWVSFRAHAGKPLVIYEGGLHTRLNVVDAAWEAWEHPEMETLYTSLLNGLDNLGVSLFCHYNGAIDHQIFGFKKYTGQPAAEAPKWRALAGWTG